MILLCTILLVAEISLIVFRFYNDVHPSGFHEECSNSKLETPKLTGKRRIRITITMRSSGVSIIKLVRVDFEGLE